MARVSHLENLLSGNHITPLYFLIDSVKSVEVLIELSEDCCCNLSVPIPNKQTLFTRYVLLSYYKVFLTWIFDSSFEHMHNYTPAACCYVTGTFDIFILSSFLLWWLSFTIELTTYLIAMVTQLPWKNMRPQYLLRMSLILFVPGNNHT